MKPTNIEIIGNELAIKWDNNTESFLSLENLRRHCPCASCAGERDTSDLARMEAGKSLR